MLKGVMQLLVITVKLGNSVQMTRGFFEEKYISRLGRE
jgi:hypothetical protein